MTAPASTSSAPTVAPVGTLARLRLSEPVRLYLYSVLTVIVAGLVLAGWLSGEWQQYALTAGAVVLGVAGAGEAARASVYSPRGAVQTLMRARQQ